jgi:16S rRNA (cytosine967-C5)-methyltransferase
MTGGDKNGSSRQPDPARLAAAGILHAVYEEGAFASLLSIQMLDDDRLEPLDRRFATAVIYGTLSRTITIDWILERLSSRPLAGLDPWVRTILRMGAWQLLWSRSVPQPAAIDESVRLAKKLANPGAANFINAVLRKISLSPPDLPAGNPSVRFSLPSEIYGILRKAYGPSEAEAMAESFLRQDSWTTARVNLLRTSRDALASELEKSGVGAEPGLYCPEALRLDLRGQPVRRLPAWQKGLLSIQDEAAMLVGHAADPSAGQLIIDLCAAPGGKTCHLAERTDCGSRILAFDSHPGRLRLVTENVERLGLSGISCQTGDATGEGMDPGLAGSADLVVADVPCSGLGLLAKKPEIRLTMDYQKITALCALQAAILKYAASLLKPGGILVYSTCTVNPAENEALVRSFAGETGGAVGLDPLLPLLPESLAAHPDIRETAAQGWIQLLPHRHGLDGFFIARMRRNR